MEAMQFIDLISDPVKLKVEYQKFQDKIAELDAKIALAGHADAIVEMRRQIMDTQAKLEADYAAGKVHLANAVGAAKIEAERIVGEAKAEAQKIRQEAATLAQAAEGAMKTASDKMSSAGVFMEELNAREKSLIQQLEASHVAHTLAAEAHAAHDAVRAKLEAGIAHLKALLK